MPEMKNPAAANGRANRTVQGWLAPGTSKYDDGESVASTFRVEVRK
ncbi:hypothetical protein OZ411_01205 [Bradyrhizobium sp. Arg237L]|nr:hypothetical protein [Bradyrhizobium sp. Arg237L]MDI4231430.1 hypothetical protein [Bradyrhizobium sp. Arg237L]